MTQPKNLTSFNSDLSSLTNGCLMFYGCKLDTDSVQHIADTIKFVSEEDAAADMCFTKIEK